MEEKLVISLFFCVCVCVCARARVPACTCANVHFLVMPYMARHGSRGLSSCLGPSQ